MIGAAGLSLRERLSPFAPRKETPSGCFRRSETFRGAKARIFRGAKRDLTRPVAVDEELHQQRWDRRAGAGGQRLKARRRVDFQHIPLAVIGTKQVDAGDGGPDGGSGG